MMNKDLKIEVYETLLAKIYDCDIKNIQKLSAFLMRLKQIFGYETLKETLSTLVFSMEYVNTTDLLKEVYFYGFYDAIKSAIDKHEYPFGDKLEQIDLLNTEYRFSAKDLGTLELDLKNKQELIKKLNQLISMGTSEQFTLAAFTTNVLEYYRVGYISKSFIRDLLEGISTDSDTYEKVIRRRVKNRTLILQKNRITEKEILPNLKAKKSEELKSLLLQTLKVKKRELISTYVHILDEIQHPLLE